MALGVPMKSPSMKHVSSIYAQQECTSGRRCEMQKDLLHLLQCWRKTLVPLFLHFFALHLLCLCDAGALSALDIIFVLFPTQLKVCNASKWDVFCCLRFKNLSRSSTGTTSSSSGASMADQKLK